MDRLTKRRWFASFVSSPIKIAKAIGFLLRTGALLPERALLARCASCWIATEVVRASLAAFEGSRAVTAAIGIAGSGEVGSVHSKSETEADVAGDRMAANGRVSALENAMLPKFLSVGLHNDNGIVRRRQRDGGHIFVRIIVAAESKLALGTKG